MVAAVGYTWCPHTLASGLQIEIYLTTNPPFHYLYFVPRLAIAHLDPLASDGEAPQSSIQ